MRDTSKAASLIAGALAVGGCNLLFGIEPGKAAGGAGGAGGTGGSGATCPPEKPATCDPAFTDAQNCCAEGRSCGGGQCSAGECTAELLIHGSSADPSGDCIAITVAGDRLFWTTGGGNSLLRAHTDGTDKSRFPMPGTVPMGATTRIAPDPEEFPNVVYFTDYYATTIGRIAIGGGAIQSFALVPEDNHAHFGSILVHGDFVYWAMQSSGSDPGRDIWRARRQPLGTATVTAEKVALADSPLGLADDADYLYFGDDTTNTIARIPWSALAEGASLPVGTDTLVQDAAPDPGAGIGELAVDDEYLYWGSGHTVWAAKKVAYGGEWHSVGTGKTSVGTILADGRDVYFSTRGGSGVGAEVIRASKGGITDTQRTMFETELNAGGNGIEIRSIAQDCGHIYILTRSECDVHKLTK